MALPATLSPANPTATSSPALGDDEIRALKNYLIDVLGVPNNLAVNPGANTPAFSISTSALMTVNWSPLTVPSVLAGTASQVLRINSPYSLISFEINGASVMAIRPSGLLMQTQWIEAVSGVTMTLGTIGAQSLNLRTNSIDAWAVDLSGMFLPKASAIDIGNPTGRVQNIYVTTLDVGGSASIPSVIGLNTPDAIGLYSTRGLLIENNSTNATGRLDISANYAVLRNPSHILRILPATNVITVDVSSGIYYNGRDQVASFSQNSWLHLYYIANASNLAGLLSLTGPPNGPVLAPTDAASPLFGYSDWGYLTSWRFGAASELLRARVHGSQFSYLAEQSALANGTATAETAISLYDLVPTHALNFNTNFYQTNSTPVHIRTTSGSDYWLPPFTPPGGLSWTMKIPATASLILFYHGNANPAFYTTITGYTVPNGGEA